MAAAGLLKALLNLGFIAGIVAIDVVEFSLRPEEQLVRSTSLGSGFSKIQGYLVPKGFDQDAGVPNYQFWSTLNGVPVQDKEFINCYCLVLYRYERQGTEGQKPVLLCRGSGQKKGSKNPEKVAFLFAAESLNLNSEVKGINLALGRTTWKNILASHSSAATAAPEGGRHDLP